MTDPKPAMMKVLHFKITGKPLEVLLLGATVSVGSNDFLSVQGVNLALVSLQVLKPQKRITRRSSVKMQSARKPRLQAVISQWSVATARPLQRQMQ
jgi:hypothetical protein